MRCLDPNNRLLDDKEYCYHGCTTKQDCSKCHENTDW